MELKGEKNKKGRNNSNSNSIGRLKNQLVHKLPKNLKNMGEVGILVRCIKVKNLRC
jgi:hypothetical protein